MNCRAMGDPVLLEKETGRDV